MPPLLAGHSRAPLALKIQQPFVFQNSSFSLFPLSLYLQCDFPAGQELGIVVVTRFEASSAVLDRHGCLLDVSPWFSR